MRLNFFKITRTVWVLGLCLFAASCQDTIPQRSLITPGTQVSTPTCTEDQDLVEETIDGEKVFTCKDKVQTRPTGAVFFKDDFCACKDNKAISLGNCSSFCSDKATEGAEILYANFTVSEAISLNSTFGNLAGWCKNPLPTDTQNPECVIQAKDANGNISTIDINLSGTSNSITAPIQDKISFDKTYIFTLVETGSGSNAKSNSIQFVKYSTDVSLPTLGPLKNVPITQYSCIVRNPSVLNDVSYFDSAYRLHFYYVPGLEPKPVPANGGILFCHDIRTYGINDQDLFPRLENTPGVFNLWDTMDPRFYDNNNNGALDVNEAIIQKTRNFGGSISTGSNFFQKFSWPGSPTIEEESGSTTAQALGYFMAPWIDSSTFKSYCLNSTHYNSSNALFKAMRDIIQVDTEGIYIGEKTPETIINADGTTSKGLADYILIRETDLKSVWFYLNNGVPTAPTDANVASVATYFYYPLNKLSPFVKTSTQRIYRVRSAKELNEASGGNENSSNGSTSTGGATTYPPHDRKIGCVPKF